MTAPRPIPVLPEKRKRVSRLLVVVCVVLLIAVIVGVVVGIRFVLNQGLTEPVDRMFGDQHLKTAVALIELHKVRFGKYPKSLADLKYTGQWDQIALHSVAYYPSKDCTSYYVEVACGWAAKPTLTMPKDFWQGTGYNEKLAPKKK